MPYTSATKHSIPGDVESSTRDVPVKRKGNVSVMYKF
jgi:hypothetical protein